MVRLLLHLSEVHGSCSYRRSCHDYLLLLLLLHHLEQELLLLMVLGQ